MKKYTDCAFKNTKGKIICKSEGRDTECPEYFKKYSHSTCRFHREGEGPFEQHSCVNATILSWFLM